MRGFFGNDLALTLSTSLLSYNVDYPGARSVTPDCFATLSIIVGKVLN